MQNKDVRDFMLFSIPLDMLDEAGISPESVVQMSASGGKIVIRLVSREDVADLVCGGDCEECVVSEFDCDSDCDTCPCRVSCYDPDETEVI